MIVLGLILILVAAAAVLFAVIATGTLTASPLSAVGITVSVTPLTMFIAGARRSAARRAGPGADQPRHEAERPHPP